MFIIELMQRPWSWFSFGEVLHQIFRTRSKIRPPMMIDPILVAHIDERHDMAVSELRDNEG